MKYLIALSFFMLMFSFWSGGGYVEFKYGEKTYRYESVSHLDNILKQK